MPLEIKERREDEAMSVIPGVSGAWEPRALLQGPRTNLSMHQGADFLVHAVNRIPRRHKKPGWEMIRWQSLRLPGPGTISGSGTQNIRTIRITRSLGGFAFCSFV